MKRRFRKWYPIEGDESRLVLLVRDKVGNEWRFYEGDYQHPELGKMLEYIRMGWSSLSENQWMRYCRTLGVDPLENWTMLPRLKHEDERNW